MTQEEIVKKAFDAYPHRPQMVIINNGFGRISIGDLNDDKRKGYIKALTEIESLQKIHGWVARDGKDILNPLHFFDGKPERIVLDDGRKFWRRSMESRDIRIPESLFPDITWESEPTEVELLIRQI